MTWTGVFGTHNTLAPRGLPIRTPSPAVAAAGPPGPPGPREGGATLGVCGRSSPGNGNGQRPKPGRSGCSQPDTIALSLIAAGQTDVGVLDTSRRACRQLASERRHITRLVT